VVVDMDVVWFCWTEVVVDRFSMVEVVDVEEDWLGGIVVVVEVWFGRMVVGMVVVEEVV